jgi:putative transposase
LEGIRVLHQGSGRPRSRPETVIADKADSSRGNPVYLRRRGIRQVIPERDDQLANRRLRGRKGSHPPRFDGGRLHERNVVKGGIKRLKYWRGLATRYDKTARDYLGGLHLASILLWAGALAEPGEQDLVDSPSPTIGYQMSLL